LPAADRFGACDDESPGRAWRWLLRQDAESVFFVAIAGALLTWFVWTLF
jgi:hypothetical protein